MYGFENKKLFSRTFNLLEKNFINVYKIAA